MKRNLIAFAVLIMALAIAVSAYWYFSTYKPKSKATDYIANLLNDPESARFRNVRLEGLFVCGEVNGKNLNGAYVGFRPFVYLRVTQGDDNILAFIEIENPDTNVARAGNSMITDACKKSRDEKNTLNSAESKNENAPIILDMGSHTVNLPVGAKSFNLSISLKLTTNDIQAKILANEPAIKSKIDALLKSTPSSDIATDDGKAKLANEIKGQIESVLGVGGISEVTFPNFSILW